LGVKRAFLWLFIWSLWGILKLRDLSFLGSDQLDNLLKDHTVAVSGPCVILVNSRHRGFRNTLSTAQLDWTKAARIAEVHSSTGNPYKGLIADLQRRGVKVELCGATARVHGWGNEDLLADIKVNTDAMARTTQLVQQGFVKITE
jgi:intracellular sulfur oxidation DsrE/DsrF family protein